MMRQFRKLLGWKQKKPRKNGVVDSSGNEGKSGSSSRRSGSPRKASTISLAMSSLGFTVQFAQGGSGSQSSSARSSPGTESLMFIGDAGYSSGLGGYDGAGLSVVVDSEETAMKMSATGGTNQAKKRSTTSSPPDETAAGVPPRLPENTTTETDSRGILRLQTIDILPKVEEGREDVESIMMRDYEDEMDALQAQLRDENALPKSSRLVMVSDEMRFDGEMEGVEASQVKLLASEETATSAETKTATSQAVRTTPPTATLLTLPPELILDVLKYLPFCTHTALYDTCGRLNRVIRDNNESYYERELAKAGGNPRSDSLLTRSIFAFQYLNRPSLEPNAHPEFDIQSSFGYIRYLKGQSACVQEVTDILQSDPFTKFLLSDEGRKQLRLPAHGNHEPEDLSHRDDVDRDLMHLWEFINFSIDKMVRTDVPMYYPFPEQKTFFDSTEPFLLATREDEEKAESQHRGVTKPGKDVQLPHDQFLVWERKRLRDLRNEYWKEDTDNLSKVESKDMRWILEVIKAVFVGVIFKPFVEGPREKNKALMELRAKALRKATRNATPNTTAAAATNGATPAAGTPATAETPSLVEWLNNEAFPSAVATPAADPSAMDTSLDEDLAPPYSQMYTEQEIRAYVSYLLATGGMKLLLTLIRSAKQNNGVLTPSQLELTLRTWDALRGNTPAPAEHMRGFDADKAREDELARNPEREEFMHLWKPTRIERIWERDCKRGGWSNWEGWVAEYYLIA